MIYILDITTLEILKTVEENAFTRTAFSSGSFVDFYGVYDSSKHMAVKTDSLPAYRKLSAGEIVEKTKYERYIDGEYELVEGEKVEDEAIITVTSPSSYHTWNSETGEYEFTEVETKRADLISAASDMKNDLEDSTVIEYGIFDTMSESISSITSAISRHSTWQKTTTWYNLDKAGILITDDNISDLTSLGLLTSDHIQRCFDTRSVIKAELESASDEVLENYDLSARWEEVSASITY
jgi:hypothetical protein